MRDAIVDSCAIRTWPLHAVAAERAHVHVVVSAPLAPERITQYLKSWATRYLRAQGHLVDHAHPWADHGSMRYLYSLAAVDERIRYVLDDHHSDAWPQRAPHEHR